MGVEHQHQDRSGSRRTIGGLVRTHPILPLAAADPGTSEERHSCNYEPASGLAAAAFMNSVVGEQRLRLKFNIAGKSRWPARGSVLRIAVKRIIMTRRDHLEHRSQDFLELVVA